MDIPSRRLVERFYFEVWNKADEALGQHRVRISRKIADRA